MAAAQYGTVAPEDSASIPILVHLDDCDAHPRKPPSVWRGVAANLLSVTGAAALLSLASALQSGAEGRAGPAAEQEKWTYDMMRDRYGGPAFWAFAGTALVPVAEVIAFAWGAGVLDAAAEARGLLTRAFDAADTLLLVVYLYAMQQPRAHWTEDGVLLWLGIGLSVASTLMGPLGDRCTPCSLARYAAYRGSLVCAGVCVLAVVSLHRFNGWASYAFAFTVVGVVVRFAMGCAAGASGDAGLIAEVFDPLDKLLLAMYLWTGHGPMLWLGVLFGIVATALGIASAGGCNGGASKARGAVGCAAIVIMVMSTCVFTVGPHSVSWAMLAFTVTVLIPVIRFIVEVCPTERAVWERDHVKLLDAFDELDTLLLTMYLFASTSDSGLVWIGCLLGLMSTLIGTVHYFAMPRPHHEFYRGVVASLAVVCIVSLTVLAHLL
eukprot:TRINITY_DN20169_c0_g1_i1.p1 TRINITY_DN20169_c0_g1~~TRINITY_DN20169_c0_g1_i1.p1  ORF type:complete len:460 (+),score=127.70 TRINITY_DN20169_c0_g1_i1:73-1380(+)